MFKLLSLSVWSADYAQECFEASKLLYWMKLDGKYEASYETKCSDAQASVVACVRAAGVDEDKWPADTGHISIGAAQEEEMKVDEKQFNPWCAM